MRYLVPLLALSAAVFTLDYYVYVNWRRYVRTRRARWTLPVYRTLMWVMTFSLPLYFSLFQWWEVEPRLARAAFFGFWALYYVPKVPVGLVLFVKDAVRSISELSRYFRGDARAEAHEQRARTEDHEQSARTDDHARGFRAKHRERGANATEDARSTSVIPTRNAAGVKDIDRAEFLRRMGWGAAAVPFIGTGVGIVGTLYDFAVHRIDVPISGLPRAIEGLTIAQISDLHAGSLFSVEPMLETVSIVNNLKPDLIAVTGDFVNHDTAEMLRILPALRALKADIGIYGCLGNHDHYAQTDRLIEQIASTPINLLVNAHHTLTIDGASLHIVGTDNTGFSQHFADLPRALEGIQPAAESARILLAHDPTFWDSHVRPNHEDIDLMLCGHTHGGQLGFELGPLRWSLARLMYDRWAGLYSEPRVQGRHFLYVNRGIGTVGPALRLGIRPEITLLTLRRS